MAVIRHADAGRLLEEALVLDLGDLVRQADVLKRRAADEAAAIVDEGRRERERLIATARREGFAKGEAEGRAQGLEAGRVQGAAEAIAERRARLDEIDAGWSGALGEFAATRERVLREARTDVLTLALLIAEKVTRRIVERDRTVAVTQLESVLGLLARRTRLVVAVHPDDEPVLRGALPGVMARFPMAEHVELAPDGAAPRGTLVARMAVESGGSGWGGGGGGGGEIDASIQTQLDRIAAELVPPPAIVGETGPASDAEERSSEGGAP